jgi:glucose/arabinose dehydrogenase
MEFALHIPMNQSEKTSIYVIAGILLLFFSGVYPPCLNSSPQHQTKTVREALPQSGKVQNNEAWPEIFLRLHAQGLQQPLHITHAGDGSGRMFVAEQPGRIQIIENGQVLGTPFLDIESRVKSGGEQGLLSVVFPPDYSSKDYFYVNYTREPDGATVISRFYLSGTNQADAGSEDILLTIDQPYANHNGGQMAFDPNDGYLYIGLGDGGSAGDPMDNAQNLNTLLGKILRIDTESGNFPYRIPEDNPFVDTAEARPEIWALGLRNPWRFSFDRETGDLYIGDVGQSMREEIDFQAADGTGGDNYGWNILEGSLCYEPPSGCTPPPDYSAPVAEYGHEDGCSVTGGFVYRGDLYPTMEGIYFYGDFCFGSIWGLRKNGDNWENILLLDSSSSISAFGEDEAGNLYLADIQGGSVHEIVTDRSKGGTIRR